MNIYLSVKGGDRYAGTLRYASGKVGHRRGLSGKSFGGSVPERTAYRRPSVFIQKSTNQNNKELHNLFLIFL